MRGFDGTKNDTDWITLPLRTNMVASGETPQYRREGKSVYIRGRVDDSTGNFPGATTTAVADLPAGFRPSALTMWSLCGTTPATSGRFWVSTTGVVNVSPAASVSDAVSLACSFLID